MCALGYGIAGPSGINDDDVEQEENTDKVETNDEDSVQVHFPNEFPQRRIENVRLVAVYSISIF